LVLFSKKNRFLAEVGMSSTVAHVRSAGWTPSPLVSRILLFGLAVGALALGFLATGQAETSQAVAQSGEDLTRLLRAMAALKAMAAIGLLAAVTWRLGTSVSPLRLALYALSCGAAVAGPVMIWGMVNVVAGAILLHGGLVAGLLILWRDPAVCERLADLVARRRARIRVVR